MKENKIIAWNHHLDKKYGQIGSPGRDKYEGEFEAFKRSYKR
jgi:hypothetical protein